MQQKIPIENLYYLLCYAWGVSDQLDKVKVDGEKCHSLENLLSMVLLNACDRLLRQGLLREYRFRDWRRHSFVLWFYEGKGQGSSERPRIG
jgi:5-methylcytosine-specific restriction enzyme subunit McrC